MPTASASPLVAVDANVVMDLGGEAESVLDALATLRQRFCSPRIVIPPTAKLELIHIARAGDTVKERNLATKGIVAARRSGIIPVNLMPVAHGIVERVAEKLRSANLIPTSEVNDSQLVAESALIGARLLLSSDEHLRGVDFERLTIELQNFDLAALVIATPREVARKFFVR
ncbi:MAG: type II toxin-antitoxin system VapC family toxin [Verrucomicrobiota bacterium]|nr:type II toxin-antitoxin system VapC family toxin [Verrucomicrobiota bacterium]